MRGGMIMKKIFTTIPILFFIVLLAGCGTALTTAARTGDVHKVKTLLDQGANVHEGPPNFLPALMEASREGHSDVVKILLDRGADVNMNFGSRTALAFAAQGRHEDTVKLLLERGADIDKTIRIMKGNPNWWSSADVEYLREFRR